MENKRKVLAVFQICSFMVKKERKSQIQYIESCEL